jgi:hypothetical protein
MRRFLRRVRRYRRRIAATTVTALALVTAGLGVAVAHTWASCHSFAVHSYPHAYPDCRASEETNRPMVMAGSGGVFLVLGVLAAYLWVEDASPIGQARRRR